MNATRFNRIDGWIIVILLQFFVFSKSAICLENSSMIENQVECGGEFSGYQYTISSPNYPESYPEKQNCVYTLRGSHLAKCDQTFNLQFLDFVLPPSENCAEDYVEIGDRSVYCGKVVGVRTYSGKDNTLVLRFHSGPRRGDKGFKILVTTLPCSDAQIDEKNEGGSTEQSGTTLGNEVTTEPFVKVKVGTRNDLEDVNLVEGEDSYPIYRPDTDFTIEDNRKYIRGEIPSPPRVESLDSSEKNVLRIFQKNSNRSDIKIPANRLEIPGYPSKLFREPAAPSFEIVTPSSVASSRGTKPSRISAYLFVSPNSAKESSKNRDSLGFSNLTSELARSDVDYSLTPPPTEILLPNRWNVNFGRKNTMNFTRQLPLAQDRYKINEKFVIPARAYGVPEEPYYPPAIGLDQEIKTGEVLDNSKSVVDCQVNPNLEPDLEVTPNFRYFGSTKNGSPVSSYPLDGSNGNDDVIPSIKYGPPVGTYPRDSFPGKERPNNWVPSTTFVPTNTVVNSYPNLVPSVGTGLYNVYPSITYPGINGRYSECCRSGYSAQRFLLASPGFPSLFYSGNGYDCAYSIAPYSSNICQLRFNFKFFNHGTDDSFCTYGYVEIDGRRYCGCKKGLSVVSRITSSFPTTISVRYTGYPKTKFNGFLIEVVQEPCSNGYPYLSRSKKDVGNSTLETDKAEAKGDSGIGNGTLERVKRNLGYSYPKPTFGLSEDTGFSPSWNPGNSIGSQHPWIQGGLGENLFSPLFTCQALSFFDWTIAAREVYLRNARCIRNGGSNGYPSGSWTPGYPGNGGPGTIIPGYPGNGGSGTIFPGYPGNGGSGTIFPGYPGNGGQGTINPGYPGTINPGYPGNPGSGTINPGYPGNPGSGTINPGYPGNPGSGTINPGYPGNPGSGTINPGYPGGGWNFPSIQCEEVNVVEGIIASPQYPTNYPNNVKKCFRFYKAPESCQLELAILDFDLENSVGCSKDYVAFSGLNRRYCGRSLAGSKALFDLSRTNIIEMYFVSDGFGSGRGFSAGFSQIPCRGLINR